MMCRKIIAAVLALSALTLSGCSFNSAEENEQVSEIVSAAAVAAVSQRAETKSTSAVTTSVTSETVIFCDEEVFDETSAEVSDTAENERSEFVKKAEENPAINVDIITDERDIYNLSETPVGYFSADYPEISGADEAVCKKINEAVKAYVDGVLQELQEYVYNFGNVDDRTLGNMYSFWINDLGRKEIRSIGCEINCNYGNLLSIYFRAFTYNIVVPIQFSEPYTMVFDLLTGELVNFDKIIADREGFDSVFEKALAEYGRYMEYNGESYFMDMDNEYDYMLFDKITVKNDCLGMYLVTPSMFDLGNVKIYEVLVPINDIAQYLTTEGRELFEGYISS